MSPALDFLCRLSLNEGRYFIEIAGILDHLDLKVSFRGLPSHLQDPQPERIEFGVDVGVVDIEFVH